MEITRRVSSCSTIVAGDVCCTGEIPTEFPQQEVFANMNDYQPFHLLLTFLAVLFLTASQAFAQQTSFVSPDLLALQGTWIRTDAPYIVELRQGSDNTLTAKYFNRRYINVEHTETARQDGRQLVMIRLRDTHYDGSTYLLGYDRNNDILEGLYIHGASGQRFTVVFTRKREGN